MTTKKTTKTTQKPKTVTNDFVMTWHLSRRDGQQVLDALNFALTYGPTQKNRTWSLLWAHLSGALQYSRYRKPRKIMK